MRKEWKPLSSDRRSPKIRLQVYLNHMYGIMRNAHHSMYTSNTSKDIQCTHQVDSSKRTLEKNNLLPRHTKLVQRMGAELKPCNQRMCVSKIWYRENCQANWYFHVLPKYFPVSFNLGKELFLQLTNLEDIISASPLSSRFIEVRPWGCWDRKLGPPKLHSPRSFNWILLADVTCMSVSVFANGWLDLLIVISVPEIMCVLLWGRRGNCGHNTSRNETPLIILWPLVALL